MCHASVTHVRIDKPLGDSKILAGDLAKSRERRLRQIPDALARLASQRVVDDTVACRRLTFSPLSCTAFPFPITKCILCVKPTDGDQSWRKI